MGMMELAKYVVQRNLLNPEMGISELVTIQYPGQQPIQLTVQISQSQVGDKWKGRQAGLEDRNSVDELDKIQVFFARDPAATSGALPWKPPIETTLIRDPARDDDQRPFEFGGESMFRCDVFEIFTFQRTRRAVHSLRRR